MDASLNNITVISQQNIASAINTVSQGFRPLESKVSQLSERISIQDQTIVSANTCIIFKASLKYAARFMHVIIIIILCYYKPM